MEIDPWPSNARALLRTKSRTEARPRIRARSELARRNVRITCFLAFRMGVVCANTGSWKRSKTAAREHRPRRAAKGTAPSVFAFSLAEEKGFEPLVTCATAVFKAAPRGPHVSHREPTRGNASRARDPARGLEIGAIENMRPT